MRYRNTMFAGNGLRITYTHTHIHTYKHDEIVIIRYSSTQGLKPILLGKTAGIVRTKRF